MGKALAVLARMAKARVLVVGDVMLDRYWYGGVDRISPEAPVPVVAVARSEERPGGAANVARNVVGIGAHCVLVAICGNDAPADTLVDLLSAGGVDHHLVRDALVNTTVKLRVVSRNQQLIRIDFETQPSPDGCRQLVDTYRQSLPSAHAVVISDYGKGGLGHIHELISIGRAAGLPVIVDPKGDDYSAYRGATLMTPNRKEFEQVAGRFTTEEQLGHKAHNLIRDLDLAALLITRSEEGMTLFERDGRRTHVAAQAHEVYDVTGAGDTVIGIIGAALAVHADFLDAVNIANAAAGIVVGHLGAVAVPLEELRTVLMEQEGGAA
ncbi:MAG: D-glycero-beta-D-manno-heptose-7-phosphate kinase [Acidiferrobacter sp.]